MANLLAILMSLAMLLTGATTSALPEEPLGRVMTIGNLEVSHNDDDAVLDLYATLGVTADGTQTLYDFYIGDNSDIYLPFQLAVTENSLLLKNDKDGQTLAVTAADMEPLLSSLMGANGDNASLDAMLSAYADMLPAYADAMSLMQNEDEMAAMRKRSWEIYDQMVERGEGVPGKVEYDGDLYDVMTYEYTLDGAQIGALTDAILDTDKRLAGYRDAYFKFLAQMPEETGLSGATSYADLAEKFGMTMRMSESIAENGLVMMDGKLTVTPPALPTSADAEPMGPISYNIHQARMDDDEYSTVTFDVPMNGLTLSTYVEYSRDNLDSHTTMTVTGNPEEGTASEDGEGDGEDALYITLDYDVTHSGDMIERTVNATLDAAGGTHVDLTLDGDHDPDGSGSSHVACNAKTGEESYAAEFDVVITNDVTERRVSGEDAVALADYSFPALMANLSEDFKLLMNSADVQTLAGIFTQTPPADVAPEADETPEAEEPEPEAEKEGLAFANPKFDWLPEGYALEDISVDEQYEDVSCMLVNAETGSNITVDITTSAYENGGMNYYVIKDDGFKDLDGLLVSEEDYDDYFLYTADDGKLNYLIYPDSKDVSSTDILNILIGLHF